MELQRGPEDDLRIRQPRAQEMLRTLEELRTLEDAERERHASAMPARADPSATETG